MRTLTPSEMLSLRELLQMESIALAKARATQPLITDAQLKAQGESGILATEGKIKAMQQFINENNILLTSEVQ